jgi:hypothetical protein
VTSRAIEALGLTEEQYADLKRMLPARKDEAVKRYLEITKFGTAEAKAAIDAIERGAVPGGGAAVSARPAWEQQAQQKAQKSQPSLAALLPPLEKKPKGALAAAEDRAIAALAALLPPGSRPPTAAEALEIAGLAREGAIDDAALRLGARWGMDPAAAAEIARRLKGGGRSPVLAVAVVFALLLLLGGAVAFVLFVAR